MTIVAKDLPYAHRSSRNVLDLLVPESDVRPPLVVYIHGGAFFFGDKNDGYALRERQVLVEAGYAVASVNYRYSTEAIWPAQLDDLRDAFAFLRSNAGELKFDGSRIASFGHSAGGHLAASSAIALAGSPETRLAASIVWFPSADFPTMDADMDASGVAPATGRSDAPDSPTSLLIGAHAGANPDLARAAGPIALLDALAPATPLPDFLIMHGALDPIVAAEQSRRLYRAIERFGAAPRLELDVLPNGAHGGPEFERPEIMEKVVAFLDDCFGRRSETRSAH